MRSGEGGITGIWMYDDHLNNGNAQLVDKDVTSLGGIQAQTSFVMYSRSWTSSEENYVMKSIEKIQQDHPKSTGRNPFHSSQKTLGMVSLAYSYKTKPSDFN
jgi:hypothetical protein